MAIIVAKLVKRRSNCGRWELEDSTPLGKMYRVDESTRRVATATFLPTGQQYRTEVIQDIVTGSWLPTELLQFGEFPD